MSTRYTLTFFISCAVLVEVTGYEERLQARRLDGTKQFLTINISDISLQEFLNDTANLVTVNIKCLRRIRGNWNSSTINGLHWNLIDQVHWSVDRMMVRLESHISMNDGAIPIR